MITDKLNKSEIKVLEVLKEHFTDTDSATKISVLADMTGLSYYSIRNIVKSLYIAGLCSKGRRDGNGETYYYVDQKLV